MTPLPPSAFTVTVEAGPGSARLHLAGDLDCDTSHQLVPYVDRCLDAHPGLHALQLDCAALRFCDSMGLSALLTVHRRTTARDVRLHLDDPPAFLQRLLRVTGTLQLFPPTVRTPQQAAGSLAEQPTQARTRAEPPGEPS